MSDETHPAIRSTGVHAALDVEVVELSASRVTLRVPIGPKVHQPYGILHGGVSALIAESAASMGGMLNVDDAHAVVGIELNASHLRSIADGWLTAVAIPARIGRRIHVWNIDLSDDEGRIICVARCTLAVIDRPASP